ncbi:ABC transporter ATP-binding protein [Streptomyces scopuliridis]|uniref:ABC transporter ATP-binding protein n=1 Tax=Streptomyces scopuliridis TaxID=452529 RepID=UPI0036AF9828
MILDVQQLVKTFGSHTAVAGVDLTITAGEVHALVGESGSGKTTLARCVLGLIQPTSGTVRIAGRPLTGLRRKELRRLRHQVQIVFQNPYAALNPRMTVQQLIAEPLREAGRPVTDATAELARVGLPATVLTRYPHQLSGGQCQRVAIARALAVGPSLLVLDEPTSALDVSVQAQILNLLLDLRQHSDLAFLLITHDLGVVRHIADRVSVMLHGELVETGPTAQVLDSPQHTYTRRLLDAVPGLHPPDSPSGTPDTAATAQGAAQ